MAKIDWYAAKTIYINSPTVSLRDLAEKFGVSLDSMGTKASKEHWLDQRITRLTKLDQKLNDKIGNDLVTEKARLMKEARFVASRGLQGISVHFPRSARESKELWESGATVQTKILGIDKSNVNVQTNIQQNFIGWDTFMSEMDNDETRTSIETSDKAS